MSENKTSDKRVLLPCPFCGSHNVKATIVPNTQGNRRYMYCLGCFAEGPWSRLDANEIELWNRREALSARGLTAEDEKALIQLLFEHNRMRIAFMHNLQNSVVPLEFEIEQRAREVIRKLANSSYVKVSDGT